ncbi:MAG TPA: hypothetical protein VK325_08130 [Pseudoxanthomonas sp.]|nr:hypothetical protein [Pseudoxanthomonas sp.]
MTKSNAKTAILAAVATMMLALSACTAEKTQEGELPEVEVKGGQLPQYKVKTKTVEVEVPDVDVEMPNDPDGKVTDEPDSSEK